MFGYIHLNACSITPDKNSGTINRIKADTTYEKVNFDSTILLIDQKSKNSETWDALFYFKEFTNLYEHSLIYFSDATLFLSRESHSEQQNKICICAMQRAPLENYIDIVRECKSLFDDGKISEDLFRWAIDPNFSKSHLIVRNYSEEAVKTLLNDIYQDKNASTSLKETIQNILSGSLWSDIKGSE